MTEQEAASAFIAADRKWAQQLERTFGPRASAMRKRSKGHGIPKSNLRAAYEARLRAFMVWDDIAPISAKSPLRGEAA